MMTQLKMVMVMVMLATMMLAILCLESSDFTNPASVDYIISKHGNFFIVRGKTMSPDDADITLHANNTCNCRWRCFVMPECVAWSFVNDSVGPSECRLATTSPRDHTLNDNPSASYFFKSSTAGGEYSWQQDNLMYLKPMTELKSQKAKAWCEDLPGHRLGIYKTKEQFHIMESLLNKDGSRLSYLDLRKSPNGLFWGDGTPYDTTELSTLHTPLVDNSGSVIFSFTNGGIHDEAVTFNGAVQFLCQVNPNHVHW